MKPLSALFLLSLSAQLAFAQWIVQPRATTAHLNQVRFIDRNNGWALGLDFVLAGNVTRFPHLSSILRTTDAGNTWSERILNNCDLWGLAFVNRSVGWAVGGTALGNGIIYKTSDGGNLWNVVDTNVTGSQYSTVCFLDELHGWIGGWKDTTEFILRTTNGGLTWQSTTDKSLKVNEIFFLDSVNGWDVGENGKIYKTTDGGATWISVYQAPNPYNPLDFEPLRRIRFTDPMHASAVGGISGVETKVWTSDGGVSWNLINKTGGSSLHGLWFADANNGWCVGGANAGLTIQKTSDGGKTWTKQLIPDLPAIVPGPVSYFEDIAFVSPTEGWIVADYGYMLKTTNGGEQPVTFVGDQIDGAPSAFHLSQNYPNPFNPSTTISFKLPAESFVTLTVFDALGRSVSKLLSEELPAGEYSRQWNASGSPSGIYYYRLQTGIFTETRKIVLLR